MRNQLCTVAIAILACMTHYTLGFVVVSPHQLQHNQRCSLSGRPTSLFAGEAGDGASGSREEKYQTAFEAAKTMKVGDLRKELESRGVSTKSFFEKSEFVKAYAEAIADNKKPKAGARASSGAGASSAGSSARKPREEEKFDPSYRDVVVQRIDRRQLMGQSVIDVKVS